MYKHYLKFISLDREDLYQISEPIGFDGATFVLQQEPKRYGRDYQFGAISKLDFINAYTELSDNIQVIDPLGNTSNRLNFGLEWLLYIYKKFGVESKVEYILETDGLFLSNGRPNRRTRAPFTTKPRLFNDKGAATNAMKCWALGAWSVHFDFEGQPDGPEPPNKKPDDRKLEDLEVVMGIVNFDES